MTYPSDRSAEEGPRMGKRPERGIGVYVIPGVLTCRAKLSRQGWCNERADFYAIWTGFTRGRRTRCTRPLCEEHARKWAEQRGLPFPEVPSHA